jgi:hypothetical protein
MGSGWFTIALFIIISFFIQLHADSDGEKKIGAGVAFQTGYLSFRNSYGSSECVVIGGSVRYYYQVRPWIRAGGGGAYLRCTYNESSFAALGYGGSMFELTGRYGNVKCALGMMIGGGGFTNVHAVSENEDGTVENDVDRHGSFIISPLFTCEHAIAEHFSLMMMADYLIGPGLKSDRFGFGPKIHAGILFVR